MKNWIILPAIFCTASVSYAQQVTTITADSVKMRELILENATRNINGFLFNAAQGRTVFKPGAQLLGDTAYVIGGDTLQWNSKGWVSLTRRDTITGVKTFKPVVTAAVDTTVAMSFMPSFTASSNKDTVIGVDFKRTALTGAVANSRTYAAWFRDKVILQGDINFYKGYSFVKDGQLYSNNWIRATDVAMTLQKPTDASPEQLVIQSLKSATGGTALKAGTLLRDSVFFTEGVQDYAFIKAMPELKQQDGATGPLRGFYITPRLTGVSDFRGVQVDMSNGTGSVLYASGTAPSAFGGLVQYLGNYNSLLSDRSLIEKRYIDSIAGSGQWTVTGNTAVSMKHVAVNALPHSNELLAVGGSMLIKKMQVTASGVLWPDYVFDRHYKMASLAELKAYVHKYKHLPGVPAAAVVEKQGVEVVTMQAILLKQVEELTLRVLQQHDLLKKQDEKLNKLEKKML